MRPSSHFRLLLVWLLLALMAVAQQGEPQQDQQEEKLPTFTVDVKLVNVFATVLDQTGAPIGGLTKDNFKIYEDGLPQNIAVFSKESELPLSIILAMDVSLSVKKDLKLEVESARRFVKALIRPQDAVSLFQFSEHVDQLTGFTSNMKKVDDGLAKVHPGSATALYDAIYLGAGKLSSRQGRKVMVVITDGGDTISSVKYLEALRAAQESEAIVYSLIIQPIQSDAGRDLGGEHALIQMSHDTGGKFFYAQGIGELDKVFQQVSEELRTQYLLAYYPTKRPTTSPFRKIKIDVDADVPNGPAVARHRTGYYTVKDSF
ncbi:MAG TPA: VWA domain-containing protein [Terriglobales bacterium]|nr:VWA domain-containing protein [Terriglobales bacterium]